MIRFLLVALLGMGPVAGLAQTWPAKPVKFVVAQAAGGAPDIVARIIAERLSQAWGRQVLVENKPGAGNIIGAVFVARSVPDGYTMFFATAASLVTNPYTFKSLPYDPARDFTPIGLIGKTPFLILAHPGVPANTLQELIALDKAQPGKLSLATDGTRNFSGMVIAWLNRRAGTSIVQVPYTSMPQGIQDTLGGRTQLVILAPAVAATHIKRGALRPLAETWARRLRDLGVYTDGAETPEAAGEFIRAELANWGRVIKEIGIEPQ